MPAKRNPLVHCQEAYDGVIQVPMQMPGTRETVMTNQRVPNQHHWLPMTGAVLKELPQGGSQWVTDHIGKTCARCMSELSVEGDLRIVNIEQAEKPEDESKVVIITP